VEKKGDGVFGAPARIPAEGIEGHRGWKRKNWLGKEEKERLYVKEKGKVQMQLFY